jgi:hypothetical protein
MTASDIGMVQQPVALLTSCVPDINDDFMVFISSGVFILPECTSIKGHILVVIEVGLSISAVPFDDRCLANPFISKHNDLGLGTKRNLISRAPLWLELAAYRA